MTSLRVRRRMAALAAVPLVLTVATGCGGGGSKDDAQAAGSPVTNTEAERLAVARFNLYDLDQGVHSVTITIPQGARTFTFTGRVDFRTGRGIAAVTTTDNPPQSGLFAWNGKGVAVQQGARTTVPATVSQQGWTARAYDPKASFDQVLEIVSALGVDRPFNELLLRQNGATWKGSTTLDGAKVDLMAAEPDGPSQQVTYYVDQQGHLPRIDINLFDEPTTPARVDIGDDTGAPAVPVIQALQPQKQPKK